MIICMYVWDH